MGQPLSLCRCKSCQPPSSSYEKVLEMLPPPEKEMTSMDDMTMTSDVIQMHSDPYYVEYETDHGNQKITYDMIHDIAVFKEDWIHIGKHIRLYGKRQMLDRLLWCIICMFEHHRGNTNWIGPKDDISNDYHRRISRARNITFKKVSGNRKFKNTIDFKYFEIKLQSESVHGIISKTTTLYVATMDDVNHIKSICEASVKPKWYTKITCKKCIIDTEDTFYVFDMKDIRIVSHGHSEKDVLRITLHDDKSYDIDGVNASTVARRIMKHIK